MSPRVVARGLAAGAFVLTALACGTPAALEPDYDGVCSVGAGPLPFRLDGLALDEDLAVNGGDPAWEAYVGTASIDGLPEGDDEARAEALMCVADAGCTDPASGDKETGTLILSFIRSLDLASVMILEGQDDGEGTFTGACWQLAAPSRDVVDSGTFEMSPR